MKSERAVERAVRGCLQVRFGVRIRVRFRVRVPAKGISQLHLRSVFPALC
jgi:hypothetical protein